MARFAERLSARGIGLEITDAAKDWLGEVGYDPTFGARPLKRAIQRNLENRLAEDLLAGRYVASDTILVDRSADGALVFKKRAGDGAAAKVSSAHA